MKEGLFLHINLRNEHNHHVSCAEAVMRREVSGETIEKLKRLFESGHTPSSALKVLKYDLQVEEQDNYVYDRLVCPDLQFCYRLVTNPINHKYVSYNLLLNDNSRIVLKQVRLISLIKNIVISQRLLELL